MPTLYKVVHWEFDMARFARHITAWVSVIGVEDIASVLDVSTATVNRWAAGGYGGAHDHPRMTNFIKACDELSLDPRDFFTTSE